MHPRGSTTASGIGRGRRVGPRNEEVHRLGWGCGSGRVWQVMLPCRVLRQSQRCRSGDGNVCGRDTCPRREKKQTAPRRSSLDDTTRCGGLHHDGSDLHACARQAAHRRVMSAPHERSGGVGPTRYSTVKVASIPAPYTVSPSGSGEADTCTPPDRVEDTRSPSFRRASPHR